VLLVDDNEDAAVLLADSLRALGHEVVVALDGAAALHAVRTFRPDVALLDIGLPVMDGFELAERLRGEPGLREMTIIAITGYAQQVDRRRTAEKGFDEHLAKPIDVNRVDAIVRGAPTVTSAEDPLQPSVRTGDFGPASAPAGGVNGSTGIRS
jgi:CheY-like chemotaxis protein